MNEPVRNSDAGTVHESTLQLPTAHRVALAFAIAVGLLVSLYLAYLKWTGQITSLRGCGGSRSCEDLLAGRWSHWLGLPVSAASMLAYAGLLAIWIVGLNSWVRITLAISCGILLFCAAVWFLSLQLFVERDVCWLCGVLHVSGLTTFVILIANARKHDFAGRARGFKVAILTNVVAMTALITGQVWGPRPNTHEIIVAQAGDDSIPAQARDGAGRGGDEGPAVVTSSAPIVKPPPERLTKSERPRTVRYMDGNIRYTLGEVPLIGEATAEHIVVEYFDYKCPSCRDLHVELKKLIQRHPDKLAAIVIPTPLDRRCNPHLPANHVDHPGACELARLSLTVWQLKPERFAEFHDKLFSEQETITTLQAQKFAAELVGESAVARAEGNGVVTNILTQSISTYRVIGRREPKLPKLLLGGRQLMNGVPRDAEALTKVLNEALSLELP